jgi:hypothetical protein
VAKGLADRRVSPESDASTCSSGDNESYQYVGENSKVHFEMRTQRSTRDQRLLRVISLTLVLSIGVMLALIATFTVVASSLLRLLREDAVMAAMWPTPRAHEEPRLMRAYIAFSAICMMLVLVAAGVSMWAPAAIGSGLPGLKAFLNGCHKSEILRARTLCAKIVGTTLVITTGLPIGREGPMVHIGAALAACISSVRIPYTRAHFELRLPKVQRNWVGVGAAAGVAAAFNAPLGGILYSFEEVRSAAMMKMSVYRTINCPAKERSRLTPSSRSLAFCAGLFSLVELHDMALLLVFGDSSCGRGCAHRRVRRTHRRRGTRHQLGGGAQLVFASFLSSRGLSLGRASWRCWRCNWSRLQSDRLSPRPDA